MENKKKTIHIFEILLLVAIIWWGFYSFFYALGEFVGNIAK